MCGCGKSAREVWCGVRRGVWRAVVRGIVEPAWWVLWDREFKVRVSVWVEKSAREAWGYGVRREFVGCGKSAREACSMA